MTHVGKIILLKYDNYKRITHTWNRKTIHNNKKDLNNVLNSKLDTFYFLKGNQHDILKKSYKIYIDYKEGYRKIGYVFWDFYMNKLYYNKYYTSKISIKKSGINQCNHVEIKEIYINPDEEDTGFTIG